MEHLSYEKVSFHEDNIICPYCGHEDYDSWESYSDGEDFEEEECNSCGKRFLKSVHTAITFNTAKDCAINNEEHDIQFEREGATSDGTPFKYYECTKCNANYHDFNIQKAEEK